MKGGRRDMQKISNLFRVSLLFVLVFLFISPAISATGPATEENSVSKKAYVVNINNEIDTITVQYVKRALKEAEEQGATTFILRLNTFGGELNSTIEIGDMLMNSKLDVVSYVESKAMSAGTIIALHTPHIYMQQGSTIGAAAVVNSKGELIDNEKTYSFIKEKVSEIAKVYNRDPLIVQAMVDPFQELDLTSQLNTIKAKGEVLSIGAVDAVKVGYAEAVVSNFDDLIVQLELDKDQVYVGSKSYTERLAKFLTHPVVVIILLVIGIAGIVIELIYPGFGAPGILGIISLSLFFFGSYIAGISEQETAFLFIIGILLIIIELFVPSFGILAILGGGAVITGILMASVSIQSGLISFAVALVIAIIIIVIFSKTQKGKSVWNKFVLKEKLTSEEGFISADLQNELVGKEGVTITALRPAGTALIGEKRVDVLTEGGFVDANKAVVVVKAEGTWVVVREIK